MYWTSLHTRSLARLALRRSLALRCRVGAGGFSLRGFLCCSHLHCLYVSPRNDTYQGPIVNVKFVIVAGTATTIVAVTALDGADDSDDVEVSRVMTVKMWAPAVSCPVLNVPRAPLTLPMMEPLGLCQGAGQATVSQLSAPAIGAAGRALLSVRVAG